MLSFKSSAEFCGRLSGGETQNVVFGQNRNYFSYIIFLDKKVWYKN